MTGDQVRKKIKERGVTYISVARAIGESSQNFLSLLQSTDVRSGLIERISTALGVPVAYFYDETFSCDSTINALCDSAIKRENELLKQLLAEKDREYSC